ncbi:MAG: hypothetical protein A2161_21820 [Candidatus Schekmanbacteria bacterium RBG_13_48_7]|uniref:4Fe-4S ferredoxin-type domain-containing protein n=1 Tax=Candidatus Schekmanbacteria bacterium RBG_13_48_7 TaxID=1817878 RepID=A0A1F7RYS5_9BACT|nr:MAG: hypothetical protein A2161_21820 [Candidatus Schekmanbacteria bacterium RBG_13_48_7]
MSGGGGGGTTSNLRPKFVPKTPPCMNTCPNHVDIRGFITSISLAEKKGKSYDEAYTEAFYRIAETNVIPATIGRVCPHPCETACNRINVDESVSINKLERTVGDFAIEKGLPLKKLTDEKRQEKIAIIGAGPAGLTCAYHLARRGYNVTIFEAFPKAGGMLRYGIPAYRLPRNILDAEIKRIQDLGVEIRCNTAIGREISYDDLKNEYNAVFVGIGAHKGLNLNVSGEEAPNVYTGAEFLHKINSGESIDLGNKVIVIGGGDTAIDAARVAKRLGADTTILYRRTIKEMPAIDEEIEEAQKEGITMEFLAAPIEVLKNGNMAKAIKCIRMELKEADGSGRPRPVPIEGSEFITDATTIISAISQEPDFSGLEQFKHGRDWTKIDFKGETEFAGTYAGGDVIELSTVTVANSHGRKAADAVDHHFRSQTFEPEEKRFPPIISHEKMRLDFYEKLPRIPIKSLPVDERFGDLEKEVNSTYSHEEALAESKRCMSCGMCFNCEKCWMYCQVNAVVKTADLDHPFAFKLELCDGCKKCAEECPCGYIEMY